MSRRSTRIAISSRPSDKLGKSMERLSSGFRINTAADDAAGLAISEKLQGQITGLDQAQRNAQDAVSLVQTAEGSLAEVHSMLQRVRDLAVQYKNGTLSAIRQGRDPVRGQQLASEIERHRRERPVQRHPAAERGHHDHVPGRREGRARSSRVTTIPLGGRTSPASTYRLSSASPARHLARSTRRSTTSRQAARAVRRGAEPARAHAEQPGHLRARTCRRPRAGSATWTWPREMVNFTKLQILQQSGTAMVAQANQLPQSVLQLLKG